MLRDEAQTAWRPAKAAAQLYLRHAHHAGRHIRPVRQPREKRAGLAVLRNGRQPFAPCNRTGSADGLTAEDRDGRTCERGLVGPTSGGGTMRTKLPSRFRIQLRQRAGSAAIGMTALAIALCGQTIRAQAQELVKFESAPYVVGQLQQRQAIERGETLAKLSTTIEGYLSKPNGSGPFPAIVYLHGCSGLSKNTRARIADLLTGWGYLSLAVDSFATRGIKEACHGGMPPRQADALGALVYLSNLPSVDATRIAVVGSSQGGIVALRLASRQDIKLFAIPEDLKFKAAV